MDLFSKFLAVLVAAHLVNEAGSSFDHSVVRGTAKEVESLLDDVPSIGDVQTAAIGSRLLYNGSDGINRQALRRFMFSQVKASNQYMYMMYTAMVDGEWFAYYNDGNLLDNDLQPVAGYAASYTAGNQTLMPTTSHEAECSRACNGSKWCRCFWDADPITGERRAMCRDREKYLTKSRPWYIEAVASARGWGWTPVYIFSSSRLPGITFFKRFSSLGESTGDMAGVVAIDYQLDGITKVLEEAMNDRDETYMYIAETNTSTDAGKLIAISLGAKFVFSGTGDQRVLVVDVNHTVIRSAARFLNNTRRLGLLKNKHLYVNDHYFVMSSPVGNDEGMQWDLVTIQRVSCVPGFFWNDATWNTATVQATGTEGCDKCPTGAICPGGIRYAVKPDYWRATHDSRATIYRCPHANSCGQGNTDDSADMLCRPGSLGPLCASCDSNYFNSAGGCVECSAHQISKGATATIVLTCLVLCFAFTFLRSKKVRLIVRPTIWWRSENVWQHMKILWAECQIIGAITHQLNVEWPPLFASFLNILTIFTDLTFLHWPVECFVEWSFFDELLIATLGPFVLSLCIPLYHLLHHFWITSKSRAKVELEGIAASAKAQEAFSTRFIQRLCKRSLPGWLWLWFFVLPTSTSTLVRFLECHAVETPEGGETFYLRADYQISCDTPTYGLCCIYVSVFYIMWEPNQLTILHYVGT